MKLLRLTGGLGNQMFIYAFYLQLKAKYPDLKLDISEIKDYKLHNGYEIDKLFQIEPDYFYLPKWLKKIMVFLFFVKIKEKRNKGYAPESYLSPIYWPFIYYKGYFQSEKFFENIQDEIRSAFSFDESRVNKKTADCLELLASIDNSVSIHIRRGDYLQPKNEKMFGNICTLSYYQKAIEMMEQKIVEPQYFIFSDDVKWVKENLSLKKAVYVDWNIKQDSWQDMLLMTRCCHNIIANSSFSWWSAWLNSNKNKIVHAPSRWFNVAESPDIIPLEWIKVG